MFHFFRTKAFRWVTLLTLVLVFIGIFRAYTHQFYPPPDVYRIARDKAWTGLGVWGNDKQLLGFSDELLIAIARQQGFYLEIINVSPRSIEEGLRDGNYDAILSWVSPDTKTKQKYDFSHPYYLLSPLLVVQEKSQLKNLIEFAEHSVGVMKDCPILKQHQNLPPVNWYTYRNITTCLDDLVNNRVDGVVLDLFSAYAFANGVYKDQIRVVPVPLTDDGIRVVTLKGESGEELLPLFNKGLEELKVNGTYEKLLKKWGLENINH